jgi:hypothetical protein
MGLSPTRATKLIAVGELQDAVKHAVRLADDSFIKAGTKPVILTKWDIIGYRLRASAVRNTLGAEKFANDVASQVTATGVRVDPVVAIVGGWITVGFIERINIPQARNF